MEAEENQNIEKETKKITLSNKSLFIGTLVFSLFVPTLLIAISFSNQYIAESFNPESNKYFLVLLKYHFLCFWLFAPLNIFLPFIIKPLFNPNIAIIKKIFLFFALIFFLCLDVSLGLVFGQRIYSSLLGMDNGLADLMFFYIVLCLVFIPYIKICSQEKKKSENT